MLRLPDKFGFGEQTLFMLICQLLFQIYKLFINVISDNSLVLYFSINLLGHPTFCVANNASYYFILLINFPLFESINLSDLFSMTTEPRVIFDTLFGDKIFQVLLCPHLFKSELLNDGILVFDGFFLSLFFL